MAAVLLALGASTAWGLADFLGGLKARSVRLPALLVVSQAAGLLVLLPALAVGGVPVPSDPRLWLGALAGLTAVADLGLIYLVLARGPVVLIAPVAAVGASIPVAAGLLGGDPIDPPIAAGLALALAGSLAASVERRGARRPAGLAKGLPLALGAAIGVGATMVLLERSSAADPLWAVAAMRAGGVAASLGLLAAARLRGRSATVSPAPLIVAPLAAIGIFDALADVGYALASSRGHLSTVAVLASLYPVVTVGLGVAVLREPVAAIQLAGVVLAVAGVALLAGAA